MTGLKNLEDTLTLLTTVLIYFVISSQNNLWINFHFMLTLKSSKWFFILFKRILKVKLFQIYELK